jgi:EpsI family protein
MTRSLLVLATMLALVFVGLSRVESRPPPPGRPLRDLPAMLGSWRALADRELDGDTLATLRADDYVSRIYERSGSTIDVFVAYYGSQSSGEAIHSPMNCLPGVGWQPLERTPQRIDVGTGQPIAANRTVVQKGLERRLVFYWYESHGRTIANEYAAKIFLVLDSIRFGRSDAALVRLITPFHDGRAAADGRAHDLARTLHPTLRQYIPI